MRKWNNHQSDAFQLQRIRRELNAITTAEMYIFVSTLYGMYIEEGKKRIDDYKHMTMFDVRSEIKLRAQMLRAQNVSRVKHHFEEEDKRSRALLEELKRSL